MFSPISLSITFCTESSQCYNTKRKEKRVYLLKKKKSVYNVLFPRFVSNPRHVLCMYCVNLLLTDLEFLYGVIDGVVM